MTDDLLQPSVSNNEPRPARPWRLRSQFWVAFFGGALAGATIAILNAARLGIPRKQRWLMIGLTAVTLAALIALWLQHPLATDLRSFAKTSREMRIYGRIAAVLLYLALAAMQRRADSEYQVFSEGEYAPLWGAGTAAVLIGGSIQTLLIAGAVWLAR